MSTRNPSPKVCEACAAAQCAELRRSDRFVQPFGQKVGWARLLSLAFISFHGRLPVLRFDFR